MKLFAAFLLASAGLYAQPVRVLWNDLFPSDRLTVPDDSQLTGKRVSMPLPDCTREPSTCAELGVINRFDGFALQPRVRIRFSGPIDPGTLIAGLRIVFLDKLRNDEWGLGRNGLAMTLNEFVYDPETNTAYAKPDSFLDQTRRFALVVTNAVRDTQGRPVEADSGFADCVAGQIGGEYCVLLGNAVRQYPPATGTVVGASVFTTMSATNFIESARNRLDQTSPAVERDRVFRVSEIAAINWRRQTGTSGDRFTDTTFPAPPALLNQVGVGRVAFGRFRSPRFLGDDLMMPALPTRQEPELPARMDELAFHVWLPATPAPAGGYPVVIAGHGITDSRFGFPSALVAGFMQRGYAIIATNAVGHGYGPETTLDITDQSGAVISMPGGGRSVDANRDGRIEAAEGCLAESPAALLILRDCLRQTALDVMQLSRALHTGIDLDGDGQVDLNPARVGYMGHSLGGFYGSIFLALDPYVKAGVLNSGGGSFTSLLTTSSYRPLLLQALAARIPSLLNADADFNDNLPLRYEPIRVNRVPGALAIQDFLSRIEWQETPGAPYAYATHFAASTLPGIPIKNVLFQYAAGDRSVPNPTESQLARAAFMRESTQFVRYDRLRALMPSLGRNPHSFVTEVVGNPISASLALAAQTQAAVWLGSDGNQLLDVNAPLRQAGVPFDVFETPELLPETLGFL